MKRNNFTKEQDEFILNHISFGKETVNEFNSIFDLTLSRESLWSRKKTLLEKEKNPNNKHYSQQELDYLRNLILSKKYDGLDFDWDGCVNDYNNYSGRNITIPHLKNMIYKKLKLSVGRSSSNHHPTPIGHEVLLDNVWYVQFRERRPDDYPRGNFMPKTRWVYEHHYNIKLKADEYIVQLDGNGDNFDIDNLFKINKNDLRYVKHTLYHIDDAKLRKILLLDAQLRATLEKEKENE